MPSLLPCSIRPLVPAHSPHPASAGWQVAWSSSSQVWQAPTLKAKHSPQHGGAGWKYHEQRRMAPEHAMQPQGPAQGSQGLTTLLVTPGLQAIVMSHHPGPCAQLRHIHMNYNQARHSHPCKGGFAQPFSALCHFFHLWRSAVNLFCCPGSQGMPTTAKAQGSAETLGTERAPHSWATRCLARGMQCSASEGRSMGLCRRRRLGMAACKHDSCKRGSP